MTVVITFVQHPYGGWEGVYKNGQLVSQGHSLGRNDWLEALQDGYTKYEEWEAGDWLEDTGHLPNTLEEFHAMGE